MELINKATVVTEIDKLIHDTFQCDSYDESTGFRNALNLIKRFLDSIEVKEADYGIEIYKYAQEHFNVYDDVNQTLQTKENKTLLGRKDFEDIAKHFFELGLKAQKGE